MANPSSTIKNRKAKHEYDILETLEAGIVLLGTEVKSLREGRASFKDSYARIMGGEAWLVNLHISHYKQGTIYNHDPLRKRKLLLHKQEIKRLRGKTEERGLTLVPLEIYFIEGLAKVKLGLARGKHARDKRRDIAKRDMDRDTQRELKNKYRI